jgi:hypothetical protein
MMPYLPIVDPALVEEAGNVEDSNLTSLPEQRPLPLPPPGDEPIDEDTKPSFKDRAVKFALVAKKRLYDEFLSEFVKLALVLY